LFEQHSHRSFVGQEQWRARDGELLLFFAIASHLNPMPTHKLTALLNNDSSVCTPILIMALL
jgi:hypothetical protein